MISFSSGNSWSLYINFTLTKIKPSYYLYQRSTNKVHFPKMASFFPKIPLGEVNDVTDKDY